MTRCLKNWCASLPRKKMENDMTTAVAMAVYNGGAFLPEQLDTIRLQTKAPDRVVICDDGSKDGTPAFIRDYIRTHGLEGKWELVENEKNLGYIRNFYKALSLCDADLLFLSDQDDVWRPDKIEKMEQVFAQNQKVLLLSCEHGFIDQSGEPIQGILTPKPSADGHLTEVRTHDIMVSFRWPGMCMAMRRDFYNSIHQAAWQVEVPHDVTLALMAAAEEGFYEYGYVGADHRRHNSNTGGEEHRISKVLNIRRKLGEVKTYNTMLQRILDSRLELTEAQRSQIRHRLTQSQLRFQALAGRSFGKMCKLYFGDKERDLRLPSMVCDYFLLAFGDYKNLEKDSV